MRKKTTEQFIKEAKNKFGERFNYSEVVYVNAYTNVKIICKEHGSFLQRPTNHLTFKHGCPKCANNSCENFDTKDVFIKKARSVHGDNYDYSMVEYTNSQEKVIIICTKHGEFHQAPSSHLQNHGCPNCAIEKNAKNTRLNQEDFINRAKKILGDKISFDKVNYIDCHTKVTLTCEDHGDFLLTPTKVLHSKRGCPNCKNSRIESLIANKLNSLGVEFEAQKTFKGCKDKKRLVFDFYIEKLNLAIEYDGRQHYDKESIFYSKNIVKRDMIKNTFCLQNGIQIVRLDKNDLTNLDTFLEFLKI